MSYKTVIKKTKKIETILVKMGAEGKGLHEKVSSIEYLIEENTVKSIRFVASIRNKLLHEDDFELTDELLEAFKSESKKVISSLTLDFQENVAKENTERFEDIFDDMGEEFNYEDDFKSENDYKSNSSSWDDFSTGEKIGIGAIALGALAVWSWFNA